MKNKIFLVSGAVLLASAVLLSVCVNNGKSAMTEFFNANVEALAQVEGLKGNCQDDSKDCLFMCSCGAVWVGKTTLKGPSYNMSGVCSNCKKEY